MDCSWPRAWCGYMIEVPQLGPVVFDWMELHLLEEYVSSQAHLSLETNVCSKTNMTGVRTIEPSTRSRRWIREVTLR